MTSMVTDNSSNVPELPEEDDFVLDPDEFELIPYRDGCDFEAFIEYFKLSDSASDEDNMREALKHLSNEGNKDLEFYIFSTKKGKQFRILDVAPELVESFVKHFPKLWF